MQLRPLEQTCHCIRFCGSCACKGKTRERLGQGVSRHVYERRGKGESQDITLLMCLCAGARVYYSKHHAPWPCNVQHIRHAPCTSSRLSAVLLVLGDPRSAVPVLLYAHTTHHSCVTYSDFPTHRVHSKRIQAKCDMGEGEQTDHSPSAAASTNP